MSEEIKKSWDKSEILAVKAWYESTKGFEQINRENNFATGTLFKLVTSIQDYKGTRCSIGKWLRSHFRQMNVEVTPSHEKSSSRRNKKMHNKPLSVLQSQIRKNRATAYARA
ncbi:MAG: hypothetical protein HDR88_17515 [Bacteroides sp.]|nr:hypothetical protein [Bacteroides sp.]